MQVLIPPVSYESWKAGAVCPPLSVVTNAIIFTFKIQVTFKRRVVIPGAQEHKQTNAQTPNRSKQSQTNKDVASLVHSNLGSKKKLYKIEQWIVNFFPTGFH